MNLKTHNQLNNQFDKCIELLYNQIESGFYNKSDLGNKKQKIIDAWVQSKIVRGMSRFSKNKDILLGKRKDL